MGKQLSDDQGFIGTIIRHVSKEAKGTKGVAILRRLIEYSEKLYGLEEMLGELSDGRKRPRISTAKVVAGMLVMMWTRMGSLNALEQTKEHGFWKQWVGGRMASADTMGRVMSEIEMGPIREAGHGIYRRLKRNKALEGIEGMSVAVLDGHEMHTSYKKHCDGCLERKVEIDGKEVIQCYHRNVTLMLSDVKMPLLLDMEPQRQGRVEMRLGHRSDCWRGCWQDILVRSSWYWRMRSMQWGHSLNFFGRGVNIV